MAYQEPSALSKNFAKICDQAFATVSAQSVHPGRFQVKFPEGFTYDSFNARGSPAVWSILKLMESARALAYWGEWGDANNFLHMRHIDHMLYVVSLKLNCEPEMYDPEVEKQPVEVNNELVYVGNTSYTVRDILKFPQVKKTVAESRIHGVFVDKDTRRPLAPPVWWKEKYSQYCLPHEGPLRVKPFDFSQVKGKVHEGDIIVQSIDLDPYCHVSSVVFIRFCYETYLAWHVRLFGYTGRGDPFRNVKSVACVFKGEAGLGDFLKVCFVQDPYDKDTYHFQILKDSNINIFECRLQFFSQLLSKY